MTDNFLFLPKSEKANDKTSIFRPRYLGNVLTGAVAAVISWGLYGPLSAYYIVGTEQALAANAAPVKSRTLFGVPGGRDIDWGWGRTMANERS